ncbi:hypothetical protein AAHE18_19G000100 [Arachis hypogaea]
MKVRSEREKTKVVIRHLPPSLTQSDLLHHIDNHFASRYNWFSFRPGNTSHKNQRHSRAYIDFKSPDDVFEFAEFFDGHVFVNERGAQHKAIVEYAPSQRVPRPTTKKDGREGTIYKDPDYLEFLKFIAKPPEHLPSAEIQLERKEAEQAGANKEGPIVTPLMEYVRQKRSVDIGAQGKLGSGNTKRGLEKKKYVQKDNVKDATRKESKDKSAFTVVPRREDQSAASNIKGISELETLHGIEGPISGIPVTSDSGKKKILLLKGKQREIPITTEGVIKQQSIQSGNSAGSTTAKQNQRREASGRLIRSILLNSEARQSQPSTVTQHKIQILSSDNGKRPARSLESSKLNAEGDSKRSLDEKFVKKDTHGLGSVGEKIEKRTRNKDRPDRGVWTPLRRSDVSHADNEQSPSSLIQPTLPESGMGESLASIVGRSSTSVENGPQRNFTRRGVSHIGKDDVAVSLGDGKASKKGGGGHGAHEKQVWVQKSSSGS